ncbi:MAG: ABC transporter permease [Candidatus Bathyarchaeota archaeon]|nr:ABC transporter permease [Candidatus Bathyarchaeota archaeon]
MRNYLIRRAILIVPTLIGVTVLTFVISHMVPGDPARLMVGLFASDEIVQRMREQLRLNEPIYIQYFEYLRRLAMGDFGTSILTKRPVLSDLIRYFPATFELTMTAMIISIGGGILLGVISAVKRDSPFDQFTRLVSLGGVSVPSFYLGILLQLALFVYLGLMPGSGRIDPFIATPHTITRLYVIDSLLTGNWPALVSSIKHLILPATTLALGTLAVVARTVRSSMLEVASQDYIKTAKAQGVSESEINYRYALRNALIPVVSLSGLMIGAVLTGTVYIETIFSWPGMGRYVVKSIFALDFPAIMGFTVVAALIFVIANLVVDLLYAFLDPRIRYE